jgi:hypothetical protein
VQPSGLVFLVLIAIWAAYLLQHWVRRREHLATARSVDRFSDAMRVLERRTPLPEPDLSAPRPRSYAVSPARPSRPEVVVKRAPSPDPNDPTGPTGPTGPDVAVRSTRIFHVLAGMSARRARGLSLLASLSMTVAAVLLAAFSVLPWWSVPVAVTVLVADVTWLRYRALSRRDRQTKGRVGGSAAGPARQAIRQSADPEPDSEGWLEPAFGPVVSAPVAVVDPAVGVAVTVGAADTAGEAMAGAAEAAGPAQIADPAGSPAEVDPYGWNPVPVPLPTYTLKAKAAPPVPAVITEPGPGQPWSLDGLVYDCELDELVEQRRIVGG